MSAEPRAGVLAASAADWVKRRIESLDTAEFEQLCALVQVELALHAEKKT